MTTRTRTAGVTIGVLLTIAALSTACYGVPPGQQAADKARTQIGTRYTYGGASPSTGFDCSGLTSWAWSYAGKSLPRSAADQYWATNRISRSQLQPGDLVFYGYSSDVTHVAMYRGNGMMVQAQKTGTVVNEQNVDTWWRSNLIGYGRVR